MKKEFEEILKVLNKWSHLGERTVANGARLIGYIPYEGSEAYLHITYAPLSEERIAQIEEEIGRKVPEDYKEFLRYSNGINLFFRTLAFYGLRKDFSRVGDEARQPFSLLSANTYEHPVDAYPHWIMIGSYSSDGSRIYIDDSTGKVYRSERKYAGNRLNEWDSFWAMIFSEVKRIDELFDECGKRKNENMPTTPEIQKDVEQCRD